MNFKPKLVAFDLDGTLAESKERMTAQMGELLSELMNKMPVAIMSGAGFPQFEKQFLPGMPVDSKFANLYLFPDNAAQCFTYVGDHWQPFYNNAFTKLEREHIIEALNKTLSEVGLASAPVRVWGERVEDRGAEIAFSPLGQQAPLEAKQEWHDAHDDLRKKLRETLAQHLPDFAVSSGGLTTIDITRKGITKAYGIKKLVELTEISVSEMLYVGDALKEGGNDAVVKESGVQTHEVFGPEETAALITTIVEQGAH